MNLHLIIGIQGAGKSTYALELKAKLESKGYKSIVYEKDDYIGTYDKFVKTITKSLNSIKSIDNLIIVGTFLESEKRQILLKNLKPFVNEALCYYHELKDSDFSYCQANILRRQYSKYQRFFMNSEEIDVKDIHIFPISALFSARKKYSLPDEKEGFRLMTFSVYKPVFDSKIYKNKALILDYDGTLRTSIGSKVYPLKSEDISILENTREKLSEYQKKDYLLLGISNQSGVAKNEISYQECDSLFKETNKLLGFSISYLFCPHRSFPVSCYCRKPQIGNLIKLIEEYKLNPELCIFVGDMTSDKTTASKLSIKFKFAKDFF